jgi:sugar phosphate isomerase/epimerase
VREAVRRAKARNFRLARQNVGGSYVSTSADSARVLKTIPDQALGLTWYPNAGASGEQAFPDGYRLLDPARIFHVHLRDYAHTPDGKRSDDYGCSFAIQIFPVSSPRLKTSLSRETPNPTFPTFPTLVSDRRAL